MRRVSEVEWKPLLFILRVFLMPFAVIVFINTLCCVLICGLHISSFKIILIFDQSFTQGAGDLRTALGSVHIFNMFQMIAINGSGAVETVEVTLRVCEGSRRGHGSGRASQSLCQASSQLQRREEYFSL